MEQEVRYVLSDDPDFDVARLKSVGGSRYIKIFDTITKKLVTIKPQEFVKFFSDNPKRLSKIIDECIAKNALFSKSEIVQLLKTEVDAAIKNLMDDLKVVNYKGTSDYLPVTNIKVGEAYNVNGKTYVCYQSDGNTAKYGRVVFADELSSYYTKEEFDQIYVNHVKTISSWLDHDVYEYTKDFYDNFVSKSELSTVLEDINQSIHDYQSQIADLQLWKTETQERVDAFIEDAADAISGANEMLNNVSGVISDWFAEQNAFVSSSIAMMSAKYDELASRIASVDESMYLIKNEVNILSGEIMQIRHGKQELLRVEYEA
jgi:hypothetical protein